MNLQPHPIFLLSAFLLILTKPARAGLHDTEDPLNSVGEAHVKALIVAVSASVAPLGHLINARMRAPLLSARGATAFCTGAALAAFANFGFLFSAALGFATRERFLRCGAIAFSSHLSAAVRPF